ncbi:hypothetical protein Hdeb2414_s0002g00052171 [Helianthus debilis subsp. tardiflorus]
MTLLLLETVYTFGLVDRFGVHVLLMLVFRRLSMSILLFVVICWLTVGIRSARVAVQPFETVYPLWLGLRCFAEMMIAETF